MPTRDRKASTLRLLAWQIVVITIVSALLLALLPQTAVRVNAQTTSDTYNTSGTWNAPAGVTSVTVAAWGGGGGGGAGAAAGGKGAGGGGAYSSAAVSVSGGTGYTVTVGGGGDPGNGGGDSWFNTSGTVMAKGGATGTATTGGGGGLAGSGAGTTKWSGGTGGDRSSNGNGGGGGGGSATESANGSSGGVGNGGGSGGSGEGSGGSGGSNNSTGSNGNVPGGGGGGGGSNRASGSGAAGRVVVTYTIPEDIISVTVADGTVSYGGTNFNASKDTTAGGLNDTQTATNDGNVAENFNIRGQDSQNWTLAGSVGSEQYKHEFCTSGSGSPDPCDASPTWVDLTTSYQTLSTNVAPSANRRFDLRITTPTTTSTQATQNVHVTIQAVAN